LIVAGHSLGSVVVYDALSTISADIAAGAWDNDGRARKKLAGLVTFGSPLDKIALYFWPFDPCPAAGESGPKAAWDIRRAQLREAMLRHFHGFRGINTVLLPDRSGVVQADGHPLVDVLWLNFFHPNDLVAGHLDAYNDVTNIRTYENLSAKAQGHLMPFPASHSFYWYDPAMHDTIVDAFLAQNVNRTTLATRSKDPVAPRLCQRINQRIGD
jgi:hypothetical protein